MIGERKSGAKFMKAQKMFTTTHLEELKRKPTSLLTWYSSTGRVEFTGPVIARWIAKTTNFFCSEFGEDSGASVVLDLPVSWRRLFWQAGAGFAGVNCLTSSVSVSEAEMVVTNQAEKALLLLENDPGLPVLLQEMGDLALRWNGQQVPGTLDAIAELSSQPDDLVYSASDFPLPNTPGELSAYGDQAVVFLTTSPLDFVELTLAAWKELRRVVWVEPGLDIARVKQQELG